MKVIATATTLSQAFKNAGRVREIVGVFIRHGFADIIYRMKLQGFLPDKTKQNPTFQSLPVQERLRLAFEELGPTFVKLGQLLATRPDLIPEAFVTEFEKLQDNVGHHPFAEVKALVEAELRSPLSEVFSEFSEVPLAAASIAQVHLARLKSGEEVAVKVQRPGIEKIISNDISILRGLAAALERYVPEAQVVNPTGLVEEFFRTILFELDFRIEANNIRRIKKNLASLDKVAVPEVYVQATAQRLLTLERFKGVRFSDREAILKRGIDPTEIVRVGTDVFFHMVMRDGLFHGDLHSGNLFVLEDGRIGIIDFGIVGRMSRRVQDSVILMFSAIIDEDYDTLAAEYVNLCQVAGNIDIGALQKDLMDNISPYIGMALGEVNIGQVLIRSTSIATKHHLVVPRELMLLFRAILTTEAMGKKLDPGFDLLPVGERLAKQLIQTRYSKERLRRDLLVIGRDLQGLVELTPRFLKRFLHKWAQNNFAIEQRNPDIADLSSAIRQVTYFGLIVMLSGCFLSFGFACLWRQFGPYLFGVPVLPTLFFTFAVAPLVQGIWRLRKFAR